MQAKQNSKQTTLTHHDPCSELAKSSNTTSKRRHAGLVLVLGAALYDALLTAAILFVAGAIAVIANGGEAIASGDPLFKAYLFAAGFPYFAWCWTHSGQTLGMKTWKVVLQRNDGRPPQLQDAALRYVAALLSWLALGAGFLWIVFDAKKRSWHDHISQTSIVMLNDD